MLPEPLHPAVVHFPIVLAVLLPIFAAGALWAIHRGARARRAWALPLALAAALSLSALVALRTGQGQEERVESVVPERALHVHEEAGERFLVLSAILLVVMAGGLLAGTPGTAARLVGTLGAVALIVAAVQVGDAGGQLVYRHGAAAAYVPGAQGATGGNSAGELEAQGSAGYRSERAGSRDRDGDDD